VITYVAGIDIPQRRKGDWIPLQRSFCESIARERKGMLLQLDDSQEVIEQFPYFTHVLRAGLRSMMAVPLISRDKVIAALVFRSREKDLYTEGLLNLAERIGAQIAGAIANAQLFKDLSNTEKSLRESEEKYRELVEFLPISVFEADSNMRITHSITPPWKRFGIQRRIPIRDIDVHQFFVPRNGDGSIKICWR